MFGMSGEHVLCLVMVVGVIAFCGWELWVSNPKHPERLDNLRKWCGVNDVSDEDTD